VVTADDHDVVAKRDVGVRKREERAPIVVAAVVFFIFGGPKSFIMFNSPKYTVAMPTTP
jgi:hypothetical protein